MNANTQPEATIDRAVTRRSATIWAPLSPGMHVGELTTEVVLARCCFGEASEELTCRQR